MFNFFKSKNVEKDLNVKKDLNVGKKYYIPKDLIADVYRLHDEYKDNETKNATNLYNFWKFIESIFPDLDDNYHYEFTRDHIMNPYIISTERRK